MAPGWGKINQAVKEQYLAQISNTGKREGRKEKINMRLESVRFPFDPSVREKLSDDDLAKGVKLKFMAQIDFKCFSKVVKSREFFFFACWCRDESIYQWDSPFFVTFTSSPTFTVSTRHFETEYLQLSKLNFYLFSTFIK